VDAGWRGVRDGHDAGSGPPEGRMFYGTRLAVLTILALLTAWASQAQGQGKKPVTAANAEAQLRQQINGNTIGVLGGIMNGTFMRFVDDIARIVDDGDNLRVLPIVGKGGAQNLRDLLYLKGVDLAIISAQSLTEFKNQKGFHNLNERICYVTLLHPEELHIFSDKVGSIQELSGKIVGFDGTGSRLAAETLFSTIGVQAKQMVPFNLIDAADKMKRGELDAVVRIGGKPISGVDKMYATNKNIKLLEVRFTDAMVDNFLPTFFAKEDYPGLFGLEQRLDTVAIGVVLIAYNWRADTERSHRVEKFTKAFFSKFPEIVNSKSSHPKWRDVNLQAQLPNWKRCPAASAWLDAAKREKTPLAEADERDARSRAMRAAPNNKGEQDRLFREFLKQRANQRE
jgi:uncharacterized protein